MIDRWLADVERELRVHGRRRRRVLDELAAHLHESAAAHGQHEALRRMGDPGAVARSFAPRPLDRAYEQRDRLAAPRDAGGDACEPAADVDALAARS